MKLKKVTTLLLAAVMCVSTLAACGESSTSSGVSDPGAEEGQTTASEAEVDVDVEAAGTVTFPLTETMEFTAFSGMNGEYALGDSTSIKQANENANITLDFTNVLSADLDEKRNLILNSGDYPDMFLKANIDAGKYGMQGVLIPLEDLIRQYAPNLTAELDERDAWQYLTAADGHVYSLPELGLHSPNDPAFWINQKWMENLGLKEPANFEELYDVLKAFKEEDANGNGDPDDEIPMFCDTGVTPFLLLGYEDYTYSAATNLAVIDGTLTYVPTHESYKELLAYITKLYAEGLLDKNAFTQGHDQAPAIGQSGDILGSFFDAGAFLTVGRDNDDDYIGLTPFADTLPLNTAVAPNTMAITDKCEHPEVLIAWADQFYSEEGGKLAWLGVEGETYQYNEEGKWEWLLGNGYGDDIGSIRAAGTMQGAYNHPSVQPDAWMTDMSPEVDPDEVYLNEQRLKLSEHGAVALPAMVYTEEENAELASLTTDINSYMTQYRAQVATGELNLDESWEEYVATLNQMGLERLMEIYTRAYEAGIAK